MLNDNNNNDNDNDPLNEESNRLGLLLTQVSVVQAIVDLVVRETIVAVEASSLGSFRMDGQCGLTCTSGYGMLVDMGFVLA